MRTPGLGAQVTVLSAAWLTRVIAAQGSTFSAAMRALMPFAAPIALHGAFFQVLHPTVLTAVSTSASTALVDVPVAAQQAILLLTLVPIQVYAARP